MSASFIITTPSISPVNIRQLLFSSFSIRSYCWAHLAQLSSDKAVEIVELILNYCPKRCKIFSKLYDEHGRQVLTLSFAQMYFFYVFPYVAFTQKLLYLFIFTPLSHSICLSLCLSLSLSLSPSFSISLSHSLFYLRINYTLFTSFYLSPLSS